MSVINVQNLTRDYGSGKGLFDVSFQVKKGEVFGFLGPNGAGKTTTIRHLMGFIRPKAGRCQIDGLDCWKNRDEIQKRLGYIPGEINFFDDMIIRYIIFQRDIAMHNNKLHLIAGKVLFHNGSDRSFVTCPFHYEYNNFLFTHAVMFYLPF